MQADLPTNPMARSRSLQRQSAALRNAAAGLRQESARPRARMCCLRSALVGLCWLPAIAWNEHCGMPRRPRRRQRRGAQRVWGLVRGLVRVHLSVRCFSTFPSAPEEGFPLVSTIKVICKCLRIKGLGVRGVFLAARRSDRRECRRRCRRAALPAPSRSADHRGTSGGACHRGCQMKAGTLHSALSDTRGVAQPG